MLSFIQELLPHVSALNLLSFNQKGLAGSRGINQDLPDVKTTTTSNHCTWVESEHPYKAASVANYR